MEKARGKIKNWYFDGIMIHGEIVSHSTKPELIGMKEIHTSRVLLISEDRKSAETLNTLYELEGELA